MAHDFVRASSQYLQTASTPVTDVPLTIACQFNSRSANLVQNLVAIDRGTSAGTGLYILGVNVTSNVVAIATDGTAATAATTTTYSIDAWSHACAVFASSTSRTAYLNGGGNTTDTTSKTVTGLSQITIGTRYNNGSRQGVYLNGQLAEVGIWNAALTEPEIQALADGASPRLIRPQSLQFYAPLLRELIDVRGGRAITNSGATVSNHPRIYL